MLRNSSIFMMLLLLAASLVGISSIYQYVEGQAPPATTPQPQQQAQKIRFAGNIMLITIYASSDGKACIAEVLLPSDRPNNLGVKPGSIIELLAPDESICVLFGQSKIGKTQIVFEVEKLTTLNAIPTTLQGNYPSNYQLFYRVIQVEM